MMKTKFAMQLYQLFEDGLGSLKKDSKNRKIEKSIDKRNFLLYNMIDMQYAFVLYRNVPGMFDVRRL